MRPPGAHRIRASCDRAKQEQEGETYRHSSWSTRYLAAATAPANLDPETGSDSAELLGSRSNPPSVTDYRPKAKGQLHSAHVAEDHFEPTPLGPNPYERTGGWTTTRTRNRQHLNQEILASEAES